VHDEEKLAQRAQQRDPGAFGQLYDENFYKIYRYIAFKVADRAEAEDLVQQVFLKAWESIESYKWKGLPFSAWLFRIAHNQLVDHLRSKGKGREASLEEDQIISDLDLSAVVEQKIRIERVVAACQHLTDAQYEVISLRFAAQLSIAETAKAMEKKEGAIKALQHSALNALRRILEPEKEEESASQGSQENTT
jgi:RNA polymerase sigma-70 factor (ECF subfamily)